MAPSAAATSSAPTSFESRPAAWDSQSIRGRRTWPAGEWPSRSCATAYLYNPAMVDSLRVTVAGYSGGFEAAGEHLDVSALDALVSPAVVLGGGPLDEHGDPGADRRAPHPVRAGPRPGDQAAVPPQDGARGDQPVHPRAWRQEADQRGEDRAVGPGPAGARA